MLIIKNIRPMKAKVIPNSFDIFFFSFIVSLTANNKKYTSKDGTTSFVGKSAYATKDTCACNLEVVDGHIMVSFAAWHQKPYVVAEHDEDL